MTLPNTSGSRTINIGRDKNYLYKIKCSSHKMFVSSGVEIATLE